jgi:8-oxo-dGTP diphosphatase
MIRRFGERKHPNIAYTLRPGSYAVLERGGKVLLTLEQGSDENLQLPGGGIDPGETPLRALYREVIEETGWTIARPRRIGAFRRFVFMPEYDIWAEKICHIFTALPVRPIGPPTEPGHTVIWADHSIASSLLGVDANKYFLDIALDR